MCVCVRACLHAYACVHTCVCVCVPSFIFAESASLVGLLVTKTPFQRFVKHRRNNFVLLSPLDVRLLHFGGGGEGV